MAGKFKVLGTQSEKIIEKVILFLKKFLDISYVTSSFEMEITEVGDFQEEVAAIKERCSVLLEKVLSLPDPPRRKKRRGIRKKNREDAAKAKPKEEASEKRKPIAVTTSSIITEKQEVVIPDSTERYETRLNLLTRELQEIRQKNDKLKAIIRDLRTKISGAKMEEEKLRKQVMNDGQDMGGSQPSSTMVFKLI